MISKSFKDLYDATVDIITTNINKVIEGKSSGGGKAKVKIKIKESPQKGNAQHPKGNEPHPKTEKPVIVPSFIRRKKGTVVDAYTRIQDVNTPSSPDVFGKKEKSLLSIKQREEELNNYPYKHIELLSKTTASSPQSSDKYKNFEELKAGEKEGTDYSIHYKEGRTHNLLVASPHGGNMEPPTSEVAKAIAGNEHGHYDFKSHKDMYGNDLHITSSKFDEPKFQSEVGKYDHVLTLHGAADAEEAVYVGGLDTEWGKRIEAELKHNNFTVKKHRNQNLQGLHVKNVANAGGSGKGVQLEISRGLRDKMFTDMDTRKEPTETFNRFVKAVRNTLSKVPERVVQRVAAHHEEWAQHSKELSKIDDRFAYFLEPLVPIVMGRSRKSEHAVVNGLLNVMPDTMRFVSPQNGDKLKQLHMRQQAVKREMSTIEAAVMKEIQPHLEQNHYATTRHLFGLVKDFSGSLKAKVFSKLLSHESGHIKK